MAGLGKFKLTDALPPAVRTELITDNVPQDGKVPGQRRGKGRGKSSGKPDRSAVAAEQVREDGESQQAQNAEASIRDKMVDIGRGNQQAGRQGGK
jgi:hypothetical protein